MNLVGQERWPMRPLRSSVWCSLGGPMCHLGLSLHHLPSRKDVQERLHVVALHRLSQLACNSSFLDHAQMAETLSVLTQALLNSLGVGVGWRRNTAHHIRPLAGGTHCSLVQHSSARSLSFYIKKRCL